MKKFIISSILLVSLIVLGGILSREKTLEQLKDNENIELAIYINDEETNTIPSKDSGYYLDLEKSTCTNNAIIQFDTNTWSPVIKNMSEYKTRCELHFGSEYKESILNGTDPVLEEPLIAVTIDNDGVVRKASLANEWYSYEKKNWANAVILFDENETYEDGEIIPEEKIESYFVWIPKYRYQLWDLGNYESLTSIDTSKVHEIPIIFGDYNTNDANEGECTTPMTSGATGNCTVGDYMTHPAFLSIPSTGFWVGKFTTTYQNTSEGIYDPENISIKPNQQAWNLRPMTYAYQNSYNYKRDLDSHMMKNTEWGAVAYLSYSEYGIQKKVRINNNSDYVTGYAANNEPTCGYTGKNEECNRYCSDGTCNTAYPSSVLASTTGNISGIYDMAGQYTTVMVFMQYSDGNVTVGRSNDYQSGFKGALGDGSVNTSGVDLPDQKYYDLYLFSDVLYNSTYNRRILGDATGEMGPIEVWSNPAFNITSWNNATLDQYFSTTYPVCGRGYSYSGGFLSDIFAFQGHHGAGSIHFRIILTPVVNN